MGVYRDRGKWYIDYYYQGRRLREAVGSSKRAAARALAARKGEIVQGRFKLEDARLSPRFEEAAARFVEWAAVNRRRPEKEASRVRPLVAFFRGKRLHDITRWLVEKYKRERLETPARRRPRTGGAVNRELALLRRIFNLAIERGETTQNPAARFKALPEPPRQERILDAAEIPQLLAAAAPHVRDVILLALNTGMRRGEILGLTWGQLERERECLVLTHTKNGRARRIPLNDVALEVLRRRPRPGPFSFGGEAALKSVRTGYEGAVRRAGLCGLRFHDLRHTAATYMVLGGADLATVKEILGHSHISLTLRYAHPTSESRRRAVGALAALTRTGSSQHMASGAVIPLAARQVSTGK